MNYEKKYKIALDRAKEQLECSKVCEYKNADIASAIMKTMYNIFPELKESEDEKIRKTIVRFFKDNYPNETKMYDGSVTVEKVIDWLEKQRDKYLFTYDDILALQCCMETSKKVQEDKELYKQLQSLHDRLHDTYWLKKQGEHHIAGYLVDKNEKIRKALINVFSTHKDYEIFFGVSVEDIVAWLKKQEASNPYSGVSFEFNGHTWGMCARDNGVEILVDRAIKERVSLDDKPQDKSVIKAINEKEEEVDNANEGEQKTSWELVREFIQKFGRMPEDEDELNCLVQYVIDNKNK